MESNIEERLRRMEESMASLTQALDMALPMVATAVDVVDEKLASEPHWVERVEKLRELVTRLTEPAMLQTLETAVDLLSQMPYGVATVVDVVDDSARQLEHNGVSIAKAVEEVKAASLLMAKVLSSGAISRVSSKVADALSQPPQRIGLWQLWRRSKDLRVSRVLGAMLTAVSSLGEEFEDEQKALTKGSDHE